MKKRNSETPANPPRHGLWFPPQTVEPKAAPAREVHPRELTLEQFRQMYFPELVSEHQDRATAPAAQREAA